MHPLRGQVVWAEIPGTGGRKPWLVVSNNQRNRKLDDVLAARITTTPKPTYLTSVVELSAEDQLAGRVLCDDIYPLYKDEITGLAGSLTPATMSRVNDGLMAALGL